MPGFNIQNLIKVALICIIGFSINFASNFSIILCYSVFLTQNGIKALPYYYITLNISSVIIGTALFIKKVSGFKWLIILTPIMGIIFISVSFITDINSPVESYIAYTVGGLFFIYSWIFYLNFINQVLTIREIKKYTGLISGISFTGAILSGLFTGPILSKFSIGFSFFLTGIAYIITVIPMFLTGRLGLNITEKKSEEKLLITIKNIINTNIVKTIAVFVIISGFIKYMVEFEFSHTIATSFTSQKDIAEFYGIFNSISRASILLCQIFFFNKILKFISITTTFKIVSLVIIMLSIISIIYHNFWIIISFQFLTLFLAKTIEQPGRNILTGAVSPDIASQVRFFTEGICYCFGVMLTGGIIALMNKFSLSSNIFFLIILITAIIYYLKTINIGNTYSEAIIDNLKSGENLKEKHYDDMEYEEMNILKTPEDYGNTEVKEKMAELLIKEQDKYILSNIIKAIGQLERDEKLCSIITTILGENSNHAVIMSSIQTMVQWSSVHSVEHILPFIYNKENEIKGTAILGVLKLSYDEETLEKAVKELINMVKSENLDYRLTGISIMGELGMECFVPAINKFLQDPHTQIREKALQACIKLRFPALLDTLSDMMKKEENNVLKELINKAIIRTKDATFDEINNFTNSLNFNDKERVINIIRKVQEDITLKYIIKAFTIEPVTLAIKCIELISRFKEADNRDIFFNCFQKGFSLLNLVENIINTEDYYGNDVEILKEISEEGGKKYITDALSDVIDKIKVEKTPDKLKIFFYIGGIAGPGIERALIIFENIISKDIHKIDLAIELIETGIEDKKLKRALLKLIP